MFEDDLVSLLIIIVFVCIYFVVSHMYIKQFLKDFGQGAVFERSNYIFLLSNLSNFLETIFNLTNWAMYWVKGDTVDSLVLVSVTPAIYVTRLYAASMALRVYRIFLLSRLRKGNISEETFEKRSSFTWTFIVSNVYSIVMVGFFIALVSPEVNEERLGIYNNIAYAFESAVFLFISYEVFRDSSHPTIVIEYVFYAIIWASGTINIQGKFGDRWRYQIPIRNLLLLSVSLFSIYEHGKLIRPPLPSNILINHIFEIEELYYDFIEYLTISRNDEMLEASNIYIEYSKAECCQCYTNFDKLFAKSKFYSKYQGDGFFENRYDSIKRYLDEVLEYIVGQYLLSTEHHQFRIHYPVTYN